MTQQQVDGLSKRKAELQAEDQRPLLGPEDQRAALLAQIKADNEACEVANQKAKQTTEAIRQLERQGITAQPARFSAAPFLPSQSCALLHNTGHCDSVKFHTVALSSSLTEACSGCMLTHRCVHYFFQSAQSGLSVCLLVCLARMNALVS